MDFRIGQLSSGSFYAYVNGYSSEPVVGSREQVEVALGLRVTPEPSVADHFTTRATTYCVHLTFQYPAWDEGGGIMYENIHADSKSMANAFARNMARDDGHLGGGQGRAYFTATGCDDD